MATSRADASDDVGCLRSDAVRPAPIDVSANAIATVRPTVSISSGGST